MRRIPMNIRAWLVLALALCGGPAAAQQSVVTPATSASIPIAGTVAAATKIVSGAAGKSIYVTAIALVPVATSVVTLTSGTGTNCGTNTANVTGAMTFNAGQVLAVGDGFGAVLVVPQGADLCLTIATAAAPGSLSYAQF
jgi:hypothetical protein